MNDSSYPPNWPAGYAEDWLQKATAECTPMIMSIRQILYTVQIQQGYQARTEQAQNGVWLRP